MEDDSNDDENDELAGVKKKWKWGRLSLKRLRNESPSWCMPKRV